MPDDFAPSFESRRRSFGEAAAETAERSGDRPQPAQDAAEAFREEVRREAHEAHKEPTGPDALEEALKRLAEAREYVGYLAAAEIDRVKLRVRKILLMAAAGLTAMIIGLAILVAAAGELLAGIAGALGRLLGGNLWLGQLLTGGGILLLTALAVWLGLRKWQSTAAKALKARYELRQRLFRERFGHSLDPADDQI